MDSITQAALGAAVGEAVLGRKVGGKAAAWGAALGTLPDLDILAYPFLDEAQRLLFHRGPTHALLFSVIIGPLVGVLLARLHRRDVVDWRGWALMAFLALSTHALLDACTAYGTQLFLPFSRTPVALSNVAIIDPLYTTPLVLGLLTALFMKRHSHARAVAVRAGLILSTAYLAATGVNKLMVDREFRSQLQTRGIGYARMETAPLPLSNFLWVGMADDESAVWLGVYSVFDEPGTIEFRRFDKGDQLLPLDRGGEAMETLLWFSRGFYRAEERAGNVYFDDLHVGRTDFYLSDAGASIFAYQLEFDQEHDRLHLIRAPTAFPREGMTFNRFVERVMRDL